MDCPSCGHPNPAAARFCGSCATPLTGSSRCPSCGAANPAGQRFCNACAQELVAAAPAIGEAGAPPDSRHHPPEHLAEKIRAGRAVLEGERKQVTVLFADVIGSMELAEESDPEEWRRIMDRFFSILCQGVHRFEGTVDKFTGDGIMALFGAPIAHEDHARRAGYAALHLQRELAAFAGELSQAQGLSFSVRMGLNSGEVVVGAIGEDLGMEYTAVGHTVGLAQRMEQLAAADTVYLTQHTASLVEGYLALTDLGEFQVKGASRPLRVHELTGVGAARGRLDVSRARGFSRFVGRDQELQVLESALEQAFAGDGQVIGIVGEAGVGKSRLCHEFTERRRAEGTPLYHVAGQAHAKSVPLLPVLQFLRAYFDIGEEDSERTARERIAGRLVLLDESFDDELPLIFDFLAVPDPERPPPRMDPDARQRQLLGLMKRLARAESAREPGVTLFEDLHWLDPASEAFLANQVEAVQGTRSLVVLNFRPEYHAPWMSRSYYRQIALAPLGAAAIEQLLADLLGSDLSLDGLAELIRERTQGNPFFIEELVQALVEAGSLEGESGAYRLAAPVAEAAVPASVQAALAARIDRLEQREKAVLQAAAVIGKEFPARVLERVVELEPAELEDALRNLVAGEFVYEQELYPEALYAFKHPLTQEVAYGSQLGERRATVHAAVARAIADHYPERLDERGALLAQHWHAAGETLEAARWHARAAVWSGTGNPTQALEHWGKVCELADALPESPETVILGLTARMFALNYGWRIGISNEEAKAVFNEAEQIAVRSGDVRSRAILLQSYGAIRGVNEGDLREFARRARQGFALAEESGDPALYVAFAPGSYAFLCTGEYREAVAICDRAIELADGDPTVGTGINYVCPYAWCHGFKGLVLATLGELEEARQLIEQGRTIAREQGDIEIVGFSHMYSTYLAFIAGEPDAALGQAQQALEIAERIGGSFSRAYAWFSLGLAERMRGEWRQAIEAIERSSAIAREGRLSVDEDTRLAVLGESFLGLGDPERAGVLVAEGLAIARAQGNVQGESIASLALARVLLSSGGPAAREEIEAALTRALELARDTEAKALEPLARVELAELARQSGDEEGRERELREAHRVFVQIGATGHAERLELELPAVS
jgi:class 3 adenylate cyclase/tetratricopeptide (TPR) repeat protein